LDVDNRTFCILPQFTNRQKLTCQMSGEERQTPWEHGALIAKAIKSVEIEGLTGPIRCEGPFNFLLKCRRDFLN
jgi:hypothetical protein